MNIVLNKNTKIKKITLKINMLAYTYDYLQCWTFMCILVGDSKYTSVSMWMRKCAYV